MKIWVDDLRPAPDGYVWIKSVDEFIRMMESNERSIHNYYKKMMYEHMTKNYSDRKHHQNCLKDLEIELVDLDHDAGDYASQGGDYINILNYLEAKQYTFPIRLHTMNPVGRRRMQAIIQHNNWRELP